MKRTHVLFDLDGTLTDSEPGIFKSLHWAFEMEGFQAPTADQVRSIIGPPFEIGLPAIGIPVDALDRVINRYRERYVAVGAFENMLYDGVLEMLDAVAAAGMSISLATAKPEVTARSILDHFGIAGRFEVQAGATLDSNRRTKAEVISHALRELRLVDGPDRGDRVIMVGDRDHDVTGALQHGVSCVGVTWGYGSAKELLDAGAVALAESPSQVADLVQQTYCQRFA